MMENHPFNFTPGPRVFDVSERLVSVRDGKVFRLDLNSPDFRHR